MPGDKITLEKLPWSTLIGQIKDQRCTPFLGAGVCFDHLPLAKDLAAELLADDEASSGVKCPLADREDLAKVCQYLAVTRQDGGWPKSRIAEILKKKGPIPATADEPHQVLASLGLRIYLTTNYDDNMCRALQQRPGITPRQEFARWTDDLRNKETSTFDDGYKPTRENPVVFHLHGLLEKPESMVATEDDYLDFLVSMSEDIASSPTGAGQRAKLPLAIRAAITNTTLLFVGYSLRDVNFRVILRGLVGSLSRSARRFSVAIQYAESDSDELLQYFENEFRWAFDLNVFWGTPGGFVATLKEKWI
jgi:hypothetical protein